MRRTLRPYASLSSSVRYLEAIAFTFSMNAACSSSLSFGGGVVRVATKYPRATQAYMERVGQTVEVVGLHGSVELAPLVGLVDAIVDLTATGRTLRENRLLVVAEVGRSTARLIANQASLKTRSQPIQALVTRIREAV